MRNLLSLLAVVFLSACQSGGVMQVSPGNYMISRTSAAGAFVNMSKMKSEVIQEANTFAQRQGGVVLPSGMEEDRPNVGFPTLTYSFSVVTPDQFNNIAALSERDWASMTSAQRLAIQQAGLDRSTYAQQQSLNRQAYNARSAVMAAPQQVQHDVNLNGNVNHNVNGTIYLKP